MKKDNRVYCIDGGFSTQLSTRVGHLVDGDPLWSARFNLTMPEAVINTHLDFLIAGADIILSNTYQASIEGYTEYLNLNEKESLNLISATVGLAQEAKKRFIAEKPLENEPLIAASIGPYGAHLHDGSEYTGSYADKISPEEIKNWHRKRIDVCVNAGVDILAVETIPCLIEAEVLVDLICQEYPNTKFWISLQCKDEFRLAHGEDFQQSVSHIWNKAREYNENLIAIGVNCLHPANVATLFKSINLNLSEEDRLPLIVYPNSGEKYDIEKGWYGIEDCIALETYIPEWVNLGAKYIGGCCRTYADDIERIKKAIVNHTAAKK